MMKTLTSLLALILGIVVFAALPSKGHAQQLPPRPEPTAIPEESSESTKDVAVPGRITGTLIDQRTGAPVAGMSVLVGDKTITSDANGNYDRSDLAPGTYQVLLQLDASQGEASQGSITIEVTSGATIVQHLFFRSPAPVVPEAPTVNIPTTLPSTGGNELDMPGIVLGFILLGTGFVLNRRDR